MKEKILLVFDKGLGHGGVESVIMSIVRNLSYKYTFDLLTNISVEKAYDKEFISYGGKILRIPFYDGDCVFRKRLDYYIRGYYLYSKAMKLISENMPYKAVHCNNGNEGGIVLAAARKAGVPIRIMHSHAVFSPDIFIRKIITEKYRSLIMKNATCLLGCSEFACSLYYNRYDKIICNSYDSGKFFWNKTDDFLPHPFKLIQVGRYSQVKNQIFSMHILKSILPIIPDATLDLVGAQGNEEEMVLRRAALDLAITDNVQFYRADADIPTLLKQADAFLLPSLSEGFGIALIEAQAVGLKCYASDAVPRTTNCGGVEYISLSDGASMWAQTIVSDYQSGRCIHQKYDCSKYSIDNIMSEYIKVYGGGRYLESRNDYISQSTKYRC